MIWLLFSTKQNFQEAKPIQYSLGHKEVNTPQTFLCKERTFNRKIMLRNEAISNVRKCIHHFSSCDIQLDIHKVYSQNGYGSNIFLRRRFTYFPYSTSSFTFLSKVVFLFLNRYSTIGYTNQINLYIPLHETLNKQ